jgi:hypothetical protein
MEATLVSILCVYYSSGVASGATTTLPTPSTSK